MKTQQINKGLELLDKLQEAKVEAREECAKIAEEMREEFLSPQYATGQPLSSFSERFACTQVAERIRNK